MTYMLSKKLQAVHSKSDPKPNHSHCQYKDYESGIKLVFLAIKWLLKGLFLV